MENNIIFKTENLEIFWHVKSGESNHKGVKVKCNALHPDHNCRYNRFAGWLSKTLALHGSINTRQYALTDASKMIAENSDAISEAILSFLKREKISDYLLCEWETAKRACPGRSVTDKIAHPVGDKQRWIVKRRMQNNAPEGTNHL